MRHKSDMIHIRLSEPLHRDLKVAAAARGESIQDYVERAIAAAIARDEKRQPSPQRDHSVEPSSTLRDQGVGYSVAAPIELPETEAESSVWLDVSDMPEDEAKMIRAVADVDWTFADADTQEGAHTIHPYPAKFIPQIPRTLIQILHPQDGTATLDPFCGSGTTLLESILLGIPAIGIDVNPLAALLARVKTTPLYEPIDDVINAIAAAARITLRKPGSIRVPDIPRLDHWFKGDIAETLAIILAEIERSPVSGAVKDVLRIALSGIIVRASNQESDVRYAAVEKTVTPTSVIALFQRNALDVSRKLLTQYHLPLFPDIAPATATVIHQDTRTLCEDLPAWRVGLIVTSPPYPNAYEYWLYHKYRMYWLGMDPIITRQDEIGARAHYSKDNGLTAESFASDMQSCFSAFSSLLPKNRYACVLIGNSRIRGTYVDNAALMTGVAAGYGFRLRAKLHREIPSSRKTFNPALGSIREESLLVFQKK